MEYKLQITNYKTGIFSISVLSGTKQGEKDKIHAEFDFSSCFVPDKTEIKKIPVL